MSETPCHNESKIALMHKTLYGNGEPQKALVTVVTDNQRRLVRIERIGYAIILFIIMSLGEQVMDFIKVEVPVPVPALVDPNP